MRAKYFNQLVAATETVLKEQGGIEFKKVILRGDDSQKTSQEVNITIGLFGALYGWVTFGMSRKTAKCLSSIIIKALLRDEKIIGNTMIAFVRAAVDKVSTQFREEGLDCYCTDPTLIFGAGARFVCPVKEKLSLNFETCHGTVEIKALLCEIPLRMFSEKIIELPEDQAIGELLSV